MARATIPTPDLTDAQREAVEAKRARRAQVQTGLTALPEGKWLAELAQRNADVQAATLALGRAEAGSEFTLSELENARGDLRSYHQNRESDPTREAALIAAIERLEGRLERRGSTLVDMRAAPAESDARREVRRLTAERDAWVTEHRGQLQAELVAAAREWRDHLGDLLGAIQAHRTGWQVMRSAWARHADQLQIQAALIETDPLGRLATDADALAGWAENEHTRFQLLCADPHALTAADLPSTAKIRTSYAVIDNPFKR